MTEISAKAVVATYAATRDQLIAQVAGLGEAAEQLVPSCPAWTVRDVVAHVSGLVADVLADVQGPLGSDEATSRQVNTRSTMTLAEICDEWAGNAEAIATVFADQQLRGLGLTADLAVHVHDLAEMLDEVTVPPSEATLAGCSRYVPLLQERVGEKLDIALAVTLDDEAWAPDAGTTPLAMTGTHADFLRSVTGRRTRSQAEAAFTWDGDPTAVLDQAFTQYGPFRPES